MSQFMANSEHEHEHPADCSCGCGGHQFHEAFEDLDLEEAMVTMVDQDTGEEFTFILADEFEFDGHVYCLLLTMDEEPSAVYVRVEEMEDGTEGFVSLEDDEYDRVDEEYSRLCEEEANQEEA